ncbi:MAG: dihydrodipicolinate synthase family protein [Saprospiraceae bacterium]|nr:dihydrodipicolinate synthase family protein [Saprospiraceae bacterium]
MNVNWQGVYPAITTAFTEGDQLDLPMFTKNLHAQLAAGVDGIILGGSLGEASSLTNEEKFSLVELALDECKNRVPIIINIAESTTRAAVELAEKAEAVGAHGLMMLPPMRYKSTDEETLVFFETIADATSLPIMIYNNPVDYKIMVTLDMFDRLLKKSNIQAVKESTRDVTNVTRIRNRFGDRMKIMCGVDTLAMEELLLGADGWVAGLVDAFPAETVAIYRLTKAGRIAEARSIYRWFMPLLELDISPQLVQNIKLASVYTGIGTEFVRAPRLPLMGEERQRVITIIEDAMANRPALPDYLAVEV